MENVQPQWIIGYSIVVIVFAHSFVGRENRYDTNFEIYTKGKSFLWKCLFLSIELNFVR